MAAAAYFNRSVLSLGGSGSLGAVGMGVGTSVGVAGVVGNGKKRSSVVASASAVVNASGGGGGPEITLPTALTLIRVAAVPAITAMFYAPGAWVAPACCLLFVVAAITDWLDGYLARKMNLAGAS